VSVAQPTQLTPTEQDALVKQIGLAMLRVAPDDWEQLTVDYRSVGRYSETTGTVVFTDGGTDSWTMPPDLLGLFARLRGGMYREGRGTWFNARYKLDHPSSYNLEYDREEPSWDQPPPPQAYPDDMRMFPRSEENVPAWLRRRLVSAPPPPRFRVARIFDGPGPAVNRPPVAGEDARDLLDYLDNAPLAGPARGYDVDRLDPDGRPSVPVAFHTDGTWIWPAAVNYYLRDHDVPPEPELVEHIQRLHFELPLIDDSVRAAAAAFLGPAGPPGGPPPGGPGRPPPGAAPARAMQPPPGPPGPPGPPPGQHQGPGQATKLAPPPPAVQMVRPPEPAGSAPAAALPSQGPPGRTVDSLRNRLADLGVPESAFRIGPPSGRAWTMEQTDEGWRVGWYDRAFVAPAMFEDVADASAFLLGKLMMDADRGVGGPVPHAPVHVIPGGPPQHPMAGDRFGTDNADKSASLSSDEPMRPSEELDVPPAGMRPPEVVSTPPDYGAGFANDGFTLGGNHAAPDAGFGAGPGYGPVDGEAVAGDGAFGPGYGAPDGGFAPGGFGPGSGGFGADSEPTVFGPPDVPGAPDDQGPGRHGGRHDADRHGGRHGGGRHTNGRPDPLRAGPDFGRQDSPPAGFEMPRPDSPRPGMARPDSPRPGLARPDSPRPDALLAEQPTTVAPPARPAAAPASGEWPISPLPGEPPLTLFRGKRLVELEPGTEIDRFGDDDGNLMYAVGTPFHERSLVPEWIDRPYRVYRVRQPIQVLSGAAIPWFDQPGGGMAYLLPDAVNELVVMGRLVEIHGRERPLA
jgi:hypothetical protein